MYPLSLQVFFHWVLTKPTQCLVPASSPSGHGVHMSKDPGIILGRYLCECVCFSVVQPGCLCPKDPKTETLDAVSPERVLAGNQCFSNALATTWATLPRLPHLIPIPYLEAGVIIHIYRRGSGRLYILPEGQTKDKALL